MYFRRLFFSSETLYGLQPLLIDQWRTSWSRVSSVYNIKSALQSRGTKSYIHLKDAFSEAERDLVGKKKEKKTEIIIIIKWIYEKIRKMRKHYLRSGVNLILMVTLEVSKVIVMKYFWSSWRWLIQKHSLLRWVILLHFTDRMSVILICFLSFYFKELNNRCERSVYFLCPLSDPCDRWNRLSLIWVWVQKIFVCYNLNKVIKRIFSSPEGWLSDFDAIPV